MNVGLPALYMNIAFFCYVNYLSLIISKEKLINNGQVCTMFLTRSVRSLQFNVYLAVYQHASTMFFHVYGSSKVDFNTCISKFNVEFDTKICINKLIF